MSLFDNTIVDGNNTPQDSGVNSLISEGEQKPLFLQFLDTVGDGSGSIEMAVDGSITPVRFTIKPAPGLIIRIARLILYVQDTGAFDADKWGNGIIMSNGIDLITTRGGVDRQVLGLPLKTTGGVAGLAYDLSHHSFGTGDEFIVSRWTLTKLGQFVRLDGDNDDAFSMVINDDLTGLTTQRLMAQGYIEKFPS